MTALRPVTYTIAAAMMIASGAPAFSAPTETVLYSFGANSNDGINPEGPMLYSAGTFYSTTGAGGGFDAGTVFAFSPNSGAETILCTFKSNGDGQGPVGSLIDVKGMLYGATNSGGIYQSGTDLGGTIFKVNPSNGSETVIHSFGAGVDGQYPLGGLVNIAGTLYGTTNSGGANGVGSVYKINPNNGNYSVIYSFKGGSDGARPSGALINIAGSLYGVTWEGGGAGCNNPGCGTVFQVTTAGVEKVLYAFKGGNDGSVPDALISINGTIYGATFTGGASNNGTVFKLTNSGSEQVVYTFKAVNDGSGPNYGLASRGTIIYGTTYYTSRNGYFDPGTAFQVSTSGKEKILHFFTGDGNGGVGMDGGLPSAGSTRIGGTLYGVTQQGGTYGGGVIFKIVP